jgi:hypothetical protein
MRRVTADVAARRGDDDGWLAVFLEFWTHVLRQPEHRARFAEPHARAVAPLAENLARPAAGRDVALPTRAERLAVTIFAMRTGLSLERLTQPEVADGALSVEMFDLWMELLAGNREV